MLTCRLAEHKDLPALANMRWDFREETSNEVPTLSRSEFCDACVEFLGRGLDSQNWAYWIAELDGEIISQVFVQRIVKVPKPSRIHEEYGYVTNVYTKPQHRGQGIGFTLLEKVQEWANAQDMEFLITWPSEDSTGFYRRAGFAEDRQALVYPVTQYVD